jgi:hypothetical protein
MSVCKDDGGTCGLGGYCQPCPHATWADLCETPLGARHWQTSAPPAAMPLGRYYASPATVLTGEQLDAAAVLAQTLDDPDLSYDMAEAVRHVLTALGCYPAHPHNAGLIPKEV